MSANALLLVVCFFCLWATVFNVHLGTKRPWDWYSVSAVAVSAFFAVACFVAWLL